MDQITPSFKELDELYTLIEDSFNACDSNKEELYWLVSILKLLMNSANQRKETCIENMQINYWMYCLYPHIEEYKKKYHHSTANQIKVKRTDAKKTPRLF